MRGIRREGPFTGWTGDGWKGEVLRRSDLDCGGSFGVNFGSQ